MGQIRLLQEGTVRERVSRGKRHQCWYLRKAGAAVGRFKELNSEKKPHRETEDPEAVTLYGQRRSSV